jgi:hypothetical protein
MRSVSKYLLPKYKDLLLPFPFEHPKVAVRERHSTGNITDTSIVSAFSFRFMLPSVCVLFGNISEVKYE